MPFRNLRDHDGTGTVSLDKDDLRRDGLVDADGEIPADQEMLVERLGRGVYLVRAVDDDEVPEMEECKAIQQLVSAEIVRLQTESNNPQSSQV